MSEITIKEVKTRRELKKFIKFPNILFKDVPTYIPTMISDDMNLLTDKNPSKDYCDLNMWIAYKDDKMVGRVAGIINRRCNEHWNKKACRFGWMDMIEDYDVFKSLMDTVVEWGKSKGMETVEGPFGFTDLDKECWAIDCFNARQNMTTLYNPEYYVKFVERYGMEILCRWQQNKMPADQAIPEKVERINKLIMEKYNLKLVKLEKRKQFYSYAHKFFHTLNDAFKDLYNFVPLTEKEIDVYIKVYFPFLNLKFVNLVVDENDNMVAFAVTIPDLNSAYKKANGHLFPFGWIYLLRALHKYETVDLLLNGVIPAWQKRGVHSIYYSEMNKAFYEKHVKWAYSNPQIIGNEAVKIWSTQYVSDPIMTRAVFGMNIKK